MGLTEAGVTIDIDIAAIAALLNVKGCKGGCHQLTAETILVLHGLDVKLEFPGSNDRRATEREPLAELTRDLAEPWCSTQS